jgi:hypothetical protein
VVICLVEIFGTVPLLFYLRFACYGYLQGLHF